MSEVYNIKHKVGVKLKSGLLQDEEQEPEAQRGGELHGHADNLRHQTTPPTIATYELCSVCKSIRYQV